MTKLSSVFILFLLTFYLISCQKQYTNSIYTEDTSLNNVEVYFDTVDSLKSGEGIEFELVSRKSCQEKTNYSKLASFKSRSLFYNSIDSAKINLPVNSVLNIYVDHKMRKSERIYSCIEYKSYILKPQNRYVLKIQNQSTKNSSLDGFGCDFEMYIRNEGEGDDILVEQVNSNLPKC